MLGAAVVSAEKALGNCFSDGATWLPLLCAAAAAPPREGEPPFRFGAGASLLRGCLVRLRKRGAPVLRQVVRLDPASGHLQLRVSMVQPGRECGCWAGACCVQSVWRAPLSSSLGGASVASNPCAWPPSAPPLLQHERAMLPPANASSLEGAPSAEEVAEFASWQHQQQPWSQWTAWEVRAAAARCSPCLAAISEHMRRGM